MPPSKLFKSTLVRLDSVEKGMSASKHIIFNWGFCLIRILIKVKISFHSSSSVHCHTHEITDHTCSESLLSWLEVSSVFHVPHVNFLAGLLLPSNLCPPHQKLKHSKGWGLSARLGKHSATWGKFGTALQAYTLNPCAKFPPNPTSRKVNA